MSDIPTHMRAVLLMDHGGLDQLEYRVDVPVPTPGANEVLMSVAACGMNNTDINTRTGWYSKSVTTATGVAGEAAEDGSWGGGLTLPLIQGADPLGRIIAVGEGGQRRPDRRTRAGRCLVAGSGGVTWPKPGTSDQSVTADSQST